MIDPIFSILYQTSNKVIHTGTGFLVYKNGVFITAGHVFRKKEINGKPISNELFRAVFFHNGEPVIYKIKHTHYKSNKIWQQKYPEFLDIAIGLLEDCNLDYLRLDRRRPLKGEQLCAMAYINQETHSYGDCFSNLKNLTLLEPKKLDNMIVLEDNALITDLPQYYKMKRDEVPIKYFYNNCITLSEKFIPSASGCPILDERNYVRAMLIGAPSKEIDLSITYALLAKHCSKSIQHRSPYIYEPFEYLSIDK